MLQKCVGNVWETSLPSTRRCATSRGDTETGAKLTRMVGPSSPRAAHICSIAVLLPGSRCSSKCVVSWKSIRGKFGSILWDSERHASPRPSKRWCTSPKKIASETAICSVFPLNLKHIVEHAHVYQGVCKSLHLTSTEEAPNILQIAAIWELLCALAFETLAFIRIFGALALRVGRA